MAIEERNAREQLEACEDWLGWQDEDLSAGLKSPEDALKLWRYWNQFAEILPEMADEEVETTDGKSVEWHRMTALGYDPLNREG